MDIFSLVATNLSKPAHRSPMTAKAEDRYYASQIILPRLSYDLVRSVAMTGVILIISATLF